MRSSSYDPADFTTSDKTGESLDHYSNFKIIDSLHKYCVFIVAHIVFLWTLKRFQKRTSRALPLLSTRWSKTKVISPLMLLEPGCRSVTQQTSSCKASVHRNNNIWFSFIKLALLQYILFSHFRIPFGWGQCETKGGQRSSGLTWRSIECYCPQSYYILGTYTLIHSQTHHHNRIWRAENVLKITPAF